MQQVTIIGLGWLGLPLACHLQQRGWRIVGSKTSRAGIKAISHHGIRGYPLHLTAERYGNADELSALLASDCLILNLPPNSIASNSIPPKSKSGNLLHYQQAIHYLVQQACHYGVKRLIFISSTSVYAQQAGEVDESSPVAPDSESGQVLARVEQWLQALPDLTVDVLRLAGLIGPGRHPGYWGAGKQPLKRGNQCVNLVHQQDVIRAIERLLQTPAALGRTYNLCALEHPLRRDYYSEMAAALGIASPQFTTDQGDSGKRVNGEQICRDLGFYYRYPDPRQIVD